MYCGFRPQCIPGSLYVVRVVTHIESELESGTCVVRRPGYRWGVAGGCSGTWSDHTFHASENLYVAVIWVGAAYLCYLGIQIVISSVTRKNSDGSDVSSEHLRNVSYGKVLVQGIWVELLNPKTILFFASFIPQFVDPSLGNVTTQMLILGMLVPLTAIPSDLIVSLSGGVMVNTLRRSPVVHRALDFLAAAVLIGIGAHLVLT